MKKLISSFAIITASLGIATGAQAGTATSTLNVSATAVAVCTVSTTAVNFGVVSGFTDAVANGDVTVNCAQGTPYQISMDAGLHYNNSQYRQLSNGAISRGYVLARPDNFFWGDNDHANTYMYGGSLLDTGNGAAQPHVVQGMFLASQIALPAGTYTDTVTVTVYY